MIKYHLQFGIFSKELKENTEIDLPPEHEHLREQIKIKLSEITALFKTREMLMLPEKLGMYTTVDFAGRSYKIMRTTDGWTVGRWDDSSPRECVTLEGVQYAIKELAGTDFVGLISPKSK